MNCEKLIDFIKSLCTNNDLQKEKTKELPKKRIALVVGHRTGKQGNYNSDGISEYEYWSEYLESHINELEDKTNYEFKIFYRSDKIAGGYTNKIKEMTHRINQWDAILAVSFHFNGFHNSDTEGFEIFTLKNSAKSSDLARTLIDLFDMYLHGDNRGAKTRTKKENGGGFLFYTKMPALLLEPYFGSSKDDTFNFNNNIDNFTLSLVMFLNKVERYI